ncbi:MAG: hypothetical protein FJ144_14555 [Deltaproteobacteria bacterium]|nr:hypothetical protein [Deltaproteobacteria bacterium]
MSSFEPLRPASASGGPFAPLEVEATLDTPRGGPFRRLDVPPAPAGVDTSPSAEELAHAADVQAARAEGVASGRAEAEAELQQLVHGLGEAIRELVRFRRSLLERYHGELLDLALEVARKVVDRQLEQHPEHWMSIIRDGVQRALDRDSIRMRVAPHLHAYLREHLGELRAELDGVKELELLEDPTLPANGCIVETSYGDLDLGIDSQITTIRTALTEPA